MTPEQAAKDRSDLATALGGDWEVELELDTLWGVTLAGLVATSPGSMVIINCGDDHWLLFRLNKYRVCVHREEGIAALTAWIRAIAAIQEPRPV